MRGLATPGQRGPPKRWRFTTPFCSHARHFGGGYLLYGLAWLSLRSRQSANDGIGRTNFDYVKNRQHD